MKSSNELNNYGFVFTNFNNSSYTRAAIESIDVFADWQKAHVVIVDNSSEPEDVESLKRIKNDFPHIHLVLQNENIGYFKGLNVGIEYIKKNVENIDWIVIGNNDLTFSPDFIEKVVSCQELLEQHPVICPDLVTLDGVHQNPHVSEKISTFREIVWDVYYSSYFIAAIIRYVATLLRSFVERKDYTLHNVEGIIYQGYGACYIIGKVFFENYESLWAPTFLMGEEYFLSKQLKDKGYGFYYEPSIQVKHHDHATCDKVPSKKLWEIARDSHKVYRQYVKPFSKNK